MDLTPAEELCKHFEGLSLKPYLCPAGVPTIGYGSTYYIDGRKVTLEDSPISKEGAERLLRHELHSTYLKGVLRNCPNLIQYPNVLNAIVDFTYNLGVGRLQTSTLKRKLLEENWDEAKDQLRLWVLAGGKKLPGLVRRREAECKLF